MGGVPNYAVLVALKVNHSGYTPWIYEQQITNMLIIPDLKLSMSAKNENENLA